MLKRLNLVDTRTKLTVFGYIRSQHKLSFKSNPYALFSNIPSSISSICILYYHLYDYFELINPNMTLSDNKQNITLNTNYRDNLTFGKEIISSTDQCIYKWYLQLNGYPSGFIIGLTSKPWNVNNNLYESQKCGQCYLFWPNVSFQLASHITSWSVKDYIRDAKSNDIVCMEVNLIDKTIKIYLNDKDKGIAFKNVETGDDIKYRLSVTLLNIQTSISLVKFTQSYCL